jgi:predicted DNA-binding protein with PD1-like motif
MEFAQFGSVYVIRLAPSEDVMASLRAFAERRALRGAYFQAIGAFSRVRLRFFDVGQKQYRDHELGQQVEVVSLLGSVARDDGRVVLHVHATVADAASRTYSGHLSEGVVRPTLEVFLTALDGELRRRRDADTGLALLALPETMRV